MYLLRIVLKSFPQSLYLRNPGVFKHFRPLFSPVRNVASSRYGFKDLPDPVVAGLHFFNISPIPAAQRKRFYLYNVSHVHIEFVMFY